MASPAPPQQAIPTPTASFATAVPFRNPITGPSFAPNPVRKDTAPLLDAPAAPISHSASRTGASKTIIVHFTDDQLRVHNMSIDVTTDTYIAEVFDRVCNTLRVDKALYVLKVTGTATVAPADRTVEALGTRNELDLVRRRFVGDGAYGISGSPGSESPNAPLLISTGGTPKKGKKVGGLHPLAQKFDPLAHTLTANYKRYQVTRKQPMSFSSSSSRILALDGEYMHIMPSSGSDHPTRNLFEGGRGDKTTTVHFSSVVGSKVSRRHPRMFRVVVYKERETKRYDFEAQSQAEAKEIVKEIESRIHGNGGVGFGGFAG